MQEGASSGVSGCHVKDVVPTTNLYLPILTRRFNLGKVCSRVA
jgi:hypothetical protein